LYEPDTVNASERLGITICWSMGNVDCWGNISESFVGNLVHRSETNIWPWAWI
jgi:hypothetical protein